MKTYINTLNAALKLFFDKVLFNLKRARRKHLLKKGMALYWAPLDQIQRHVENLGRVRCLSHDCAFNNGLSGCWLQAGVGIQNGRCGCYNTAPVSVVFPNFETQKPNTAPASPDTKDSP